MKATVLQETTNKALTSLARAYKPGKSYKPIKYYETSKSIGFAHYAMLQTSDTALHVSVTDKEVWQSVAIGAQVEQFGKCSIHFTTFKEIVALYPPERIDIMETTIREEPAVLLQCGSDKTRIVGLNTEYMPKFPDLANSRHIASFWLDKAQREAISHVLKFADQKSPLDMEASATIRIENGNVTVACSNGYTLSNTTINAETHDTITFSVYAETLQKIVAALYGYGKNNDVHILIDDKFVTFRIGEYDVSCERYNYIIPKFPVNEVYGVDTQIGKIAKKLTGAIRVDFENSTLSTDETIVHFKNDNPQAYFVEFDNTNKAWNDTAALAQGEDTRLGVAKKDDRHYLVVTIGIVTDIYSATVQCPTVSVINEFIASAERAAQQYGDKGVFINQTRIVIRLGDNQFMRVRATTDCAYVEQTRVENNTIVTKIVETLTDYDFHSLRRKITTLTHHYNEFSLK